MTTTDFDYQGLLDRIVAILQHDTTNLYAASKLQSITAGAPARDKNFLRYAYVTFDRIEDTFYATGTDVSSYTIYAAIVICVKGVTLEAAEYAAKPFVRYAKAAIKNNQTLTNPSTGLDAKVARAWPVTSKKRYIQDSSDVTYCEAVIVRATYKA